MSASARLPSTLQVFERGWLSANNVLLFDGDETGVGQFLQVERQGVAGHVELVGQHAGRESFRAGNDQGAEHAQTLGMRQRAQGGNGLIFVHCSIIQQSLN